MKFRGFPILALASLCLTLASCTDAEAGLFKRRARSRPVAVALAPMPVPAYSAAAAIYDQSWFVGWLNGVRASYGLAAVGYDANLANWAAANSAEQSRRGLGHFVFGPARRQNSAMGSAAAIGPMWLNSPAHRAALLDPTIRWIGLAVYGGFWTLNAY